MIKAKPVPKREVAVAFHGEEGRLIQFYSTEDAATAFESFGEMYRGKGDRYSLTVDSRYDFKEVLAYIQNYG